MNEKKKIKILCLGDSLTEGFYNNGQSFHPYTLKLKELLKKDYSPLVINYGQSGDSTLKMLNRLKEVQNLQSVDVLIVLGGTNDLCQESVPYIINHLYSIKQYAIEKGIEQIIMLGLPEMEIEQTFPLITDKRQLLNKTLCLDDSHFYLDLEAIVPMWLQSQNERNQNLKKNKLFWDDHLHCTPQGYDFIGQELYNTFFS